MMAIDIRGIAERGVNKAFEVLNQLAVSGTVIQPANVYDPNTGGMTDSETLYPISEILQIDYEVNKIDGQIIRRKDKRALFRVSEISVNLTNEMILRFSGSDEWDIIDVAVEPSGTLYELQIRRP